MGFYMIFSFLYHSILKLWILMCQLGTEYNEQIGTQRRSVKITFIHVSFRHFCSIWV